MAPTSLKPPTRVTGHMSTDAYGTLLDELTADMPADLMFPTSVNTYASMRRETHLAAILAGWGLQLRRAQWQVDPAGCRPEVAAMVADDLGLPVKGDDKPKAARTRGVSWHEHLRSALQSLVYGFFGFEMHAEMVDGRARLVGLYERPPWTVGEIHVDPTSGLFRGVTQDAASGKDVPQINADRLVWYAREREGANWAGVSLLRPVWPIWLVKREMLRVAATGHRRFSVPTPVMEALPGTNPTAGQMAEASELSGAVRVGEQGGAATPPGFRFRLVGAEGSTSDVLGFLRYLDESASKACLSQYLDLGSTQTGSRALGNAFIDNLMLALQSEADSVSDAATRQIAARLVEWNHGPGEPVPQITASGIGAKRETTAESLQLLLSSGALSGDPGLEAWIRREWRLPERETPAPPPAPPAPVNPPTPTARVARPKGRRRREAAGQMMLPVTHAAAARELTELEQQSGVDPDAIAQEIEQAQQALAEQWPDLSDAMIAALVAAVVTAVAAGALDDLGSLLVPDDALADIVTALADAMTVLAESSANRAADELRSQGVDVDAGTVDADRLNDSADAFASIIAAGYATGAGRVALQHAGPDADPDAVGEAVREHLDTLSTPADTPGGWVATNLGGALAQAVHAGRISTFGNAPDGTRFMASEVLDRSTCKACEDADGTVFDTLADALELYPVGGLKSCEGGLRCRGLVVALPPEGE